MKTYAYLKWPSIYFMFRKFKLIANNKHIIIMNRQKLYKFELIINYYNKLKQPIQNCRGLQRKYFLYT